MTPFYAAISTHYDHIFPLMSAQVDFVLSALGDNRRKVLEIGSATGNLSTALAQRGKSVTGIDLDGELIEMARQRAADRALSIAYEQMDMTALSERFAADAFDAVVCVGNTLVHLPDGQTVQRVLRDIFSLLSPGGVLVLQIINYDRILDNRLEGLPPIENDHIVFERHYRHQSNGTLAFETRLLVKATGETLSNSVPLFPMRRAPLDRYLTEAGFERIRYAGSFKGAPLETHRSQPLIVSCMKP